MKQSLKHFNSFCLFFLLSIILMGYAQAQNICATFTPPGDTNTTNVYEFYDNGIAKKFYDKKSFLEEAALSKKTLQSVYQYYAKDSKLFLQEMDRGYIFEYDLNPNKTSFTSSFMKDEWQASTPFNCPTTQQLSYLSRPECLKDAENCCPDNQAELCKAIKQKDITTLEIQCKSSSIACNHLLDAYKKKNGSDGLFSMYEFITLNETALNSLSAACIRHKTPELCNKTAQYLWSAQRFDEAKSMLMIQCKHMQADACETLINLAAIDFPKKPVKNKVLPCGEFETKSSLLGSTLSFENKGIVNQHKRARLENDLIKIRHDKGGDFVLVQIDPQTLVGLDDWNSYTIFKKTGGNKSCTTTPIYEEKSYPEACPMVIAPQTCCAQGNMAGCNQQANIAALSNRWQEAETLYRKVCQAKIRAGCENLIYTSQHTGNIKKTKQFLSQTCKKDKKHLACDVLETTNWAAYELMHQFNKELKK